MAKKESNMMPLIGRIGFIVGLVISIAAGWVEVGQTGLLTLVVLGIVVGLLNVTGTETSRFLLAALVLVTAGLALSQVFGDVVLRILTAYIAFTGASAFIVALKEVFVLQRD